jgi:hypothetical protein
LLRYLIFPEGIHIHVEPGNIFRRKAGIKMEELDKIIEDLKLESTEVWSRDKDGNLVKVNMY